MFWMAFRKFGKNNGVEFRLGVGVSHIKISSRGGASGKIESVILENGEEIKGKNFILATGGLSHPETGSTGDGFRWLKKIGHKVVEPNPSLVPIKIKENWISEFAGITLDNAGIAVYQAGQKSFSKKGRLLFTHDGLSGPTILNMSKEIGDLLKKGEVRIVLDFFPGVGLDVMHENIKNIFEKNPKKMIKNLSFKEVPEKIYLKMLKLMGMDGEWYANEVRRPERFMIVEKFKKFELTVEKLLGYDRAIISSGGADFSEVDFKEMKSKLYDNLFLIGDVLDFDRPSGGFSLQLCWTTGYVAGKSAAQIFKIDK